MGIRGAFVVPHPPIIVEEVGHRREKSVEEVINAYRQVAREIAAWKPDTIIITSPHTEFYADYFHIAGGKEAVGDFEESLVHRRLHLTLPMTGNLQENL